MKSRRLAKKLFPGGRIDAVMARSCAIKDLDAGTEPKSCEVLARGQLNTCNTRFEHFLVRTDKSVAFIRIYATAPGAAYAEGATILEMEDLDTPEAKSLESYARQCIEAQRA